MFCNLFGKKVKQHFFPVSLSEHYPKSECDIWWQWCQRKIQTRSKTAKLKAEPAPAEPDTEGEEWETEWDEDGEGPLSQPCRAASPQHEMVTLLRQFMGAQRSREEAIFGELRGLRTAIHVGSQPPSPAASSVSLMAPQPQPPVPAPRKDPKLLPFQFGEDIENYLLRFERIARTWAWPETEWAYRLVPLLTGKASEAYSAMDEERSDSYPDLKQALLAKFDISSTSSTYCQRFRDPAVPQGETPTETYQRLKGLYRRWIKPDQCSVEDIGEAIMLEQLLRVFPSDILTWVREREPTTGVEAAKLATQYVNARRLVLPRSQQRQPNRGPGDSRQEGQKLNDYGTQGKVWVSRGGQQASASQGTGGASRYGQQVSRTSTSRGEIICYYCQQPGHKASDCPLKNLNCLVTAMFHAEKCV